MSIMIMGLRWFLLLLNFISPQNPKIPKSIKMMHFSYVCITEKVRGAFTTFKNVDRFCLSLLLIIANAVHILWTTCTMYNTIAKCISLYKEDGWLLIWLNSRVVEMIEDMCLRNIFFFHESCVAVSDLVILKVIKSECGQYLFMFWYFLISLMMLIWWLSVNKHPVLTWKACHFWRTLILFE